MGITEQIPTVGDRDDRPAEHRNLALFDRCYAAFTGGDLEALSREFAPDLVWHTTGSNVLSGTYRGREVTLASFAREFELSGGTYQVSIREVLAGADHVVGLLHATAERAGRRLDQDYAIIFRVRDEKVAEAWESWTDQAAVDEFWGPADQSLP